MIDKNVSIEDYRQLKRMNPSTLVRGIKSMKSLRRAILEGFKEPTDAMRMGTGAHVLTLEPEQFESRYCVMPDFHLDVDNLRKPKNKKETVEERRTTTKSTEYYRKKVEAFSAVNPGVEIVPREKYDMLLHAVEAIRSHHEAGPLLESCGSNFEVTVTGEICGVEFKGRLDALSPTCIIDLKTTATVEPHMFGRMFANLNYGFKLSIYKELVRQSISDRPVKVIAQELDGDFDTVVFEVPEAVLDAGFTRVQLVLADYKHALETGVWPGVDRGEKTVQLVVPNWAMNDAGEEMGEPPLPYAESVEEAYF